MLCAIFQPDCWTQLSLFLGCKSSWNSIKLMLHLRIGRLQLLCKVLPQVLMCEWSHLSVCVFPSHRDVWIWAVSEGHVTDQDPLSWGHRGHESSVQGNRIDIHLSTDGFLWFAIAFWHVISFAAGARSPGHRCHDGETRCYNRRNRSCCASGKYKNQVASSTMQTHQSGITSSTKNLIVSIVFVTN